MSSTPKVKTHRLEGAGVYVFNQNNPSIVTANGFSVPQTAGVQLHHIMTVNLAAGTIQHVVNGVGGQADNSNTGVPQFIVNYRRLIQLRMVTDASARRKVRVEASVISPERVDRLAQAAVVDVAHHGVEGRQIEAGAVEQRRGLRVGLRLRDVASARDRPTSRPASDAIHARLAAGSETPSGSAAASSAAASSPTS